MAPEPETLAEALEEIQRLTALGNRLAGALELVTTEIHTPVVQRRAARDTERGYICLLETAEQMDTLAEPVADWLVGTGMKLDELRLEKQSVAAKVARAR